MEMTNIANAMQAIEKKLDAVLKEKNCVVSTKYFTRRRMYEVTVTDESKEDCVIASAVGRDLDRLYAEVIAKVREASNVSS